MEKPLVPILVVVVIRIMRTLFNWSRQGFQKKSNSFWVSRS